MPPRLCQAGLGEARLFQVFNLHQHVVESRRLENTVGTMLVRSIVWALPSLVWQEIDVARAQ